MRAVTNETISWKFVEENYPDFENSAEVIACKEELALEDLDQDKLYKNHLLVQVYQKAIISYMNKKHAELKNKELETDLEDKV